MSDTHTTGIEYLDRRIGGGIADGSLVALETPPGSQGELLLKEVATTHDSLYLSTTRSDADIRGWLEADRGVDVEYAGTDRLIARGGDAVREWITDAVGWSDVHGDDDPRRAGAVQLEAVTTAVVDTHRPCIVVDPVNPLERADEEPYQQFLHCLKQRVDGSSGMAFLHVVESASPSDARWLTLQMADEVWRVSVDVRNDHVDYYLSVTKSRHGGVPGKRIKLEMDRSVDIDTSRNIG